MLVHLEPKDPRPHPLDFGRRLGAQSPTPQARLSARALPRAGDALARDHARVDHEEHVGERRAKVGAVDRAVAGRLGRVQVLAPRAVELDGLLVGEVRQTEGEERLAVAQDARAAAKVALLVLLDLEGRSKSAAEVWMWEQRGGRTILERPREVMMKRAWMRPYRCRADDSRCSRWSSLRSSSAARMRRHGQSRGQQIERGRKGGGGQARRTGRVGDEVERGRVALHLCVEAREVEAIEDVLLVDLAEVLVALRREEPAAAGTRRKG